MAQPSGVAEAAALTLVSLGVAMRPCALVLAAGVDEVVVEASMGDVEEEAEVETIEVAEVLVVEELTVEVEFQLLVLLCPFPPLASEPLPPPTVF